MLRSARGASGKGEACGGTNEAGPIAKDKALGKEVFAGQVELVRSGQASGVDPDCVAGTRVSPSSTATTPAKELNAGNKTYLGHHRRPRPPTVRTIEDVGGVFYDISQTLDML